MGTLIVFFTGLYGKAIALAVKLLAIGTTFLTGFFAKIGIKLLSYEWIKKIFEIAKQVFSVIKKVVFNEKVVAILKYVLSIALCGVALTQIFFVGQAVYANFSEYIELLKTLNVGAIIFSLVLVTGVISTVALCVSFILKVFKKKIQLSFVPVILITFLLLRFLSECFMDITFIIIVESFYVVDAFVIILLAYAFIKLFDGSYPASFFGVVFTALAILVAFLIFMGGEFGSLMNFEIVGEVFFTGKNVKLLSAIEGVINPSEATGLMRVVTLWGLSFAKDSGNLVSGLIVVMSTFVILVSHLLPYALMSCVIGLTMGLIKERQQQFAYLTKVIKTLGYMLIAEVVATVFAFVLAGLNTPEGVYLLVSHDIGAIFLTLGITLVMMILTAIARALFTRKLYSKQKLKINK